MNNDIPYQVATIAEICDGVIHDCTLLSDGTGFATMSMPLPDDHWLYTTNDDGYVGEARPTMLLGDDTLSREFLTQVIRPGVQHGLRAATRAGREDDFDPDAVVSGTLRGLFGVFTSTGRTSIEADMGHPVFDPEPVGTFKELLLKLIPLALSDGIVNPAEIADAMKLDNIQTVVCAVQTARESARQASERSLAASGILHEPNYPSETILCYSTKVLGSLVDVYQFTFDEVVGTSRKVRYGAVMSFEQQIALHAQGLSVHKFDEILFEKQDFHMGICTHDFSCCRG